MIMAASSKMAKAVEQGQKVLSTCWAGINRSSLLTAYIIKNLNSGPLNSKEIIRTLERSEVAGA